MKGFTRYGRALLLAAVLAVAFSADVFAGKWKTVAVTETIVDAKCGDGCKGIKQAEIGGITEELRRAAENNLPEDIYIVLTAEAVKRMNEQLSGGTTQKCTSDDCTVTLMDKEGADYIVKSRVSKSGQKYTLSVEMYETKNNRLAATLADPVRSDKLIDILEKIPSGCAAMYKKFLSEQGGRR